MANFTYFIPSNFQGMDQAILRNPNAPWQNGANPLLALLPKHLEPLKGRVLYRVLQMFLELAM